jgi:hypothetical protein
MRAMDFPALIACRACRKGIGCRFLTPALQASIMARARAGILYLINPLLDDVWMYR